MDGASGGRGLWFLSQHTTQERLQVGPVIEQLNSLVLLVKPRKCVGFCYCTRYSKAQGTCWVRVR